MNLTLLFLVKEDRVLLAMKKRGFGSGKWNGIGGKVQKDETVERAMIREAEEEVGITPHKYEKMAEIVFDEIVFGKKEANKVIVFKGSSWEGEPKESEEMAPKWFKVNRLPLDQMWDSDKYWLPQILSGKRVAGQISLDENDKMTKIDLHEVPTPV